MPRHPELDLLSPLQRRRMLKADKALGVIRMLARQAPNSLAAHARLIHHTDQNVPLKPADHHKTWIDVLEDRERYRWLVIVAPPGYAKSSWVTVAYGTWRIGATGGRERIGLISNTATQAEDFANSIRAAIVNPYFSIAYPGVRPDFALGWRKNQFWVTGSLDATNPTLMASGMGGPITGKRFDEIILDDPTTYEEARSRVMMEHQRNFVKNTVLTRFPAGMGPPDGNGRMVVACTRWGENDLVPMLQDLGFFVLRMPALGYWDRQVDHESGDVVYGEEALWPERASAEALGQLRDDDPIMFDLVYQGNPKALSGDIFPGPFQYGSPPRNEVVPLSHDLDPETRIARQIRHAMDTVVQYVDTASGKRRAAGDFFALATVGIRKNGTEVWILDMDRDRYPAPKQEEAVIRNAEKWDPERIVIEDVNEGTALYQRLMTSSRLPLVARPPGTADKESRAVPLAGAYQSSRVFHPGEWVNDTWVTPRWVRPYESELLAFPNGTHDDQVDAAAGAYNESGRAGPRIRVLG